MIIELKGKKIGANSAKRRIACVFTVTVIVALDQGPQCFQGEGVHLTVIRYTKGGGNAKAIKVLTYDPLKERVDGGNLRTAKRKQLF